MKPRELRGEHTVADSGDDRRNGGVRFAVPRAPLDVWLDQKKEGIEAHLLDLTLASGVACIGG